MQGTVNCRTQRIGVIVAVLDDGARRYENIEPGVNLMINLDGASEITYLNVMAKASLAEE
jgi:hypothetical protein